MIFNDIGEEKETDPLNWMRTLQACPMKNAAAKQERRSRTDSLLISVRRKRPRILIPPLSWFIRINDTQRFKLDKLGVWVWDLCDGKRRIEEIIDEFAAQFKLTFHEARVSVTSYVKDLTERGALVLVVEQ
jgi:hypothetical protein